MTAARRFVAGIDSSTQSCKVVIADPDSGDILRTGAAPHRGGPAVLVDRPAGGDRVCRRTR